jgi:predicted methyltransferase
MSTGASPAGRPLLTQEVHAQLLAASRSGERVLECSLDLKRSRTSVQITPDGWIWQGQRFPYLQTCKQRTIYYWDGTDFQPASRFTASLIKLVPTEWGPPTFEIDGIKMLPTAHVSPHADAQVKVGYVRPQGKVVLDTCGGLGYFAAWCLQGGAAQVISCEKNPDVLWLRTLNPWSPAEGPGLRLIQADITQQIRSIADASIDAILHDPPRFGIAGELYSGLFYDSLARVLRHKGKLFHYTGSPNKLTSGRDVRNEVAERLRQAGFAVQLQGDGVLATKEAADRRSPPR